MRGGGHGRARRATRCSPTWTATAVTTAPPARASTGLRYALPGRDILVRTGLARLACRLGCPLHRVALRWDEGRVVWDGAPSLRLGHGDDPAAVTRELFDWAFGVIGARPAQWQYWAMLRDSSACFAAARLARAAVARGAARRQPAAPSRPAAPTRRGTARLVLEHELEVWGGDVLADLTSDRFYPAAGLRDEDLDPAARPAGRRWASCATTTATPGCASTACACACWAWRGWARERAGACGGARPAGRAAAPARCLAGARRRGARWRCRPARARAAAAARAAVDARRWPSGCAAADFPTAGGAAGAGRFAPTTRRAAAAAIVVAAWLAAGAEPGGGFGACGPRMAAALPAGCWPARSGAPPRWPPAGLLAGPGVRGRGGAHGRGLPCGRGRAVPGCRRRPCCCSPPARCGTNWAMRPRCGAKATRRAASASGCSCACRCSMPTSAPSRLLPRAGRLRVDLAGLAFQAGAAGALAGLARRRRVSPARRRRRARGRGRDAAGARLRRCCRCRAATAPGPCATPWRPREQAGRRR